MSGHLVKVCGNADLQSLKELLASPRAVHPTMLGFIAYQNSKRYVSKEDYQKLTREIPKHIQAVLVTVNENISVIKEYHDIFPFSVIQLHGEENATYIKSIKAILPDVEISKAVAIFEAEDLRFVTSESVSYYLFDTKTSEWGGSGMKFDWNLLCRYEGKTPFMLSGGIDSSDVSAIKRLFELDERCLGVDINSCFEIAPGKKDVGKVISFISELRE